MCLGALRGEHSLKVARRARAGQTFPLWPLELGLGTRNPRFVAWPLESGLRTRNPRFVAWPLELGLGTPNPRFVACPLELGLGTLNPRFVAWPLELGLGTLNPRFVSWPLELGLGTLNPRFVASVVVAAAAVDTGPSVPTVVGTSAVNARRGVWICRKWYALLNIPKMVMVK